MKEKIAALIAGGLVYLLIICVIALPCYLLKVDFFKCYFIFASYALIYTFYKLSIEK